MGGRSVNAPVQLETLLLTEIVLAEPKRIAILRDISLYVLRNTVRNVRLDLQCYPQTFALRSVFGQRQGPDVRMLCGEEEEEDDDDDDEEDEASTP